MCCTDEDPLFLLLLCLSDYSYEQEIFFIGGIYRFRIIEIIDAASHTDHSIYVKALSQLTYSMTNGEWICSAEIAKTDDEKQIVWRLLSHEIWRSSPDRYHEWANEYKLCLDYIKSLLHKHCLSIKYIRF